jgi:hypothetical protein
MREKRALARFFGGKRKMPDRIAFSGVSSLS